jgi:DNA-binding response OmpR family regulator
MLRVLAVDDDDDLRELIRYRLQKAGHKVLTAASADEALALIDERGGPDVAVLDVTLPGMSGLELLPALRERDGLDALPAVFLSARVQEHDIAAGRALGATYLTKPFVGSALDAAITRAVADNDGW